jgi:hypothetical protein
MRKHHLLTVLLLIGVLILGGAVALADQEKKQNGSSSTVSEPKGDQTQTQQQTQEGTREQVQTEEPIQEQEQTQERKREKTYLNEDMPCFTAEDGNTYRWQHRYSRKLQKLEEQGDEESMNKYLEKIASRYNFEYTDGADDFVHWAIQKRPWDTE